MSEEFFTVITPCLGEISKMCVRDGVAIEYVRLVRGWESPSEAVTVVITEPEYVGKKTTASNTGEEKIGGRSLTSCTETTTSVKAEKLGVPSSETLILNLYDDTDSKSSICEGRKEKPT